MRSVTANVIWDMIADSIAWTHLLFRPSQTSQTANVFMDMFLKAEHQDCNSLTVTEFILSCWEKEQMNLVKATRRESVFEPFV